MLHRDMLIEIVRASPWLMRALRAVRGAAPPGACVGAGAVRSTVWDLLHGHPSPSPLADVDVAYFDPNDMSPEGEVNCQRRLTDLEPDIAWDVANQAAVHLWYERRFGEAATPFHSLEDAIGSWPETATAVAVRLGADDTLHVVAPCGLADLFDCVVRRNPTRVSADLFRARVETKRYGDRWPRVRVVWE